MTYDPNKQYRYKMPGLRDHNRPITGLHRFDGLDSDYPWLGVVDGQLVRFKDNDPRIVEVDPVLGYIGVYPWASSDLSIGEPYQTLAKCQRKLATNPLGILVRHASGRIRLLPADATTDPEGETA